MVIGIDASRANRDRKTGTEWYSFYLIKNLAIIDKRNHYRLYLDSPPSAELIAAVRNNSNFSFHFLKWPFGFFWTLGRLSLEMIWRRPDVLFVPAHGLPLFRPRRTANTVHDVAFVRAKNLYRSDEVKTSFAGGRSLINLLVKLFTFGRYRASSLDYLSWSTSFSLRRAKKIITVSNFSKQEILKFYPRIPESRIKVIYNGYDASFFRKINDEEDQKEVLAKYGLEKPFFLYVGRLEKKKNTLSLIEAMSLIKDNNLPVKEKLVLIGDAGFGYDEIKYAIEEFDLERRIDMPGWVDEQDLPQIFNAATALVFPSRHEGFGLPIIQAFACGLPVVASDLPVFREVAVDAVLYFDLQDRESLVKVLSDISTNESLRKSLSDKGLIRAKDFSWEKCAVETLSELENWA